MSTSFSATRFGYLLKAHWAESRNQYAWFVCVAAIVDLVLMIISFSADTRHAFHMFQYSQQIGWYVSGLFTTGIIFAGLHFKYLSSPGSALIALMRPASQFEKLLLTVLVVSVLFPVVYSILYCLLNYPAVQLAKTFYVAQVKCSGCSEVEAANFSFYVPFFSEAIKNPGSYAPSLLCRTQIFFVMVLWILQALVLCGTALFKNSPILKTVLALFLLWMILISTGLKPPATAFWFEHNSRVVAYSMLEIALSLAHWIGLLLLLWGALYFHLKEREVS